MRGVLPQRVLEAVRKAALPAVWSQGAKLARENAVSTAGPGPATGGEVVMRVRAPGVVVAPTVTLYLGDDVEWTCDCGGKLDPCAHVAAAAIVVGQGQPAGDGERKAETASDAGAAKQGGARLVYKLGREGNLMTLGRVIVRPDGTEEPVVSLEAGGPRGKAAAISATHDDIRVDRILGPNPRRFLPLARVADLFSAMAASEVLLDGQRVKVSGAPILPIATVLDATDGFLLRIDRNPAVSAVVSKGVARSGETLRPLGEVDLTGDLLERLPLSRVFRRQDEADLVTKVLPELEKKLDVAISTSKLPRRSLTWRPRIDLDLSHHGHTFSVLPTLVYGSPPIARIEGDKLTSLGAAVPVRRREEEIHALARLRDELNLVPGRRVHLDGVEAIRFAQKVRAYQAGLGGDAAVLDGAPLTGRISFVDGTFDLVFEGEPTQEGRAPRRADGATVIRAWQDGLDLVPLEGGGWAPLPVDWLEKHGHRVADLLSARDTDRKLPRSALPDLGALCDDLEAPRPMELGRLAPLLDGLDGIPAAVDPPDLRATLRPYQRHGVDWLAFLRDAELGAVLADDMGLGKTLQVIVALRGRALVVCPKSVLYNWAGEIARFRPSMRVAIFHGSSREVDPEADVTLTTYAVLRLDAGALAVRESWDAVVLDEAQAIKNESSQTARAAFTLQGHFRVALSGTPVENRLEELWSIMHFANPGLLGGRSDFQERYVGAVAAGDPGAAARLRTKIRPFVLRRMKRDVLPELPPRTDQVIHVELDERERAVYDAVRAATRSDLVERLGRGEGVLAALEALLRLRQASCHSGLVPGQEAETSSKIEAVVEALSDAAADGHKALVFSQWTSLLDRLEPHLVAAGLSFVRLDGSTRDRAEVVERFQSEGGPPVMLVSLKAGGTGLNLTAADHVFLLDPWWNPAVEDQAADRAHRIGQDRPVMVYRMVAKDTVEERILALQERKRGLADAALGEASQAAAITKEELLGLLA